MRLLALTLDYSGHFKTVEYNSQGQNTVFVYSTFSSKVFLLPSKGKVNVYLSDEKGWSVSLSRKYPAGTAF
jgi:type IV secretory pathway VirB9-like protein